jgi:hypothetical protein
VPRRSKNASSPKARRGRPSRAQLYARLDEAIVELQDRFGGLPSPIEAAAIWDDIWVHEAHNSTAIEGNTLVLHQVEVLLREGRAVGSRPLAEYLEVRGYGDAARWVYSQALTSDREPPGSLLTLTDVREVHSLAISAVWEVAPHPHATEAESPGGFRVHDIAPFPAGMRPPSHALVPALMRDWLDSVQNLRRSGEMHLMERLAARHAEFERIHPFLDGNGRAGRLLLNLLLGRLGYPPAIIRKRDRDSYLHALRRADGGVPGPLAELITRAVLDNLYRFVVPAVAGPAQLVPIAALADESISLVALRNAAQRGRLRARHGPDGQWRSSRAWVEDYLAARHQRKAR